jgi:DNA ligase (NAD+)
MNLIEEIAKSKGASLPRVIHGLGIRHVGRALADTLAAEFGSIDALAEADRDRLLGVADVGPEVAASISQWFGSAKNRWLIEKLKRHGVSPRGEKRASCGRLAGKTLVITGELESITREEAEDLVRQAGGKPTGNVSKSTDYLVVGASPGGTKMRAAEKYGTRIISHAEFMKLLGR